MPKKSVRPNAYRPERYNVRTLHEEREYGFFWYEWLWKILRPVLIFLCSLLIVVGLITTVWNKVDGDFFQPVEPGSVETVKFAIEDGQSITSIGSALVKENLLRNASVFKYISDEYPSIIGTVSGIVGLAGGMGGFVLPIMFGALMDLTGIRSSAFMLMYAVVWVSLIWMYWTEVRKTELMGHHAPASPLAKAAAR
jgi:nitrate/nitrite transporter NarK